MIKFHDFATNIQIIPQSAPYLSLIPRIRFNSSILD